MCRIGAAAIRLDAFAYAVKKQGTSRFFIEHDICENGVHMDKMQLKNLLDFSNAAASIITGRKGKLKVMPILMRSGVCGVPAFYKHSFKALPKFQGKTVIMLL